MLKNMTIKKKMMIFILGLTVAIYTITLGYTIYSLRKDAIKEAKKLADTYASDKANDIKAKLDEDMAITRAMTLIMQDYVSLPTDQREDFQYRLMRNILEEYPKYEAVWLSWQLQYIDNEWYKEYGRLSINCYWENGEIKTSEERKDLEGYDLGGVYYRLLTNKEEVLTEPYEFDSYDVNSTKTLLAVSPTKTLVNSNGNAIGVMGVDMSLEEYSKMTNLEGLEQGYAFLVSNDGTIVAHNNPSFTNQKLDTLGFTDKIDFNLNEVVANGETRAFTAYSDEFDGDVYVSITPITVGRSDAPWSVGIVVPYAEITASISFTFRLMIAVASLGLLLLSFVIWKISGGIVDSLESTNLLLKDISLGDIDPNKKIKIIGKDRLGQIATSVNKLMDELNKKAEFAKQIGQGDLEVAFEKASEQDVLGDSLISMRDNLKSANVDESHRRWTTEGLAKFAVTLQSNADNMNELCGEIISNLVKYMEVVQGGIFLINDDDENDQYIELRGAYAYERQKSLKKRMEIEEGLIGQSILEKKHIYINEIPDDYVNVTSGLGKANPNTVLIVPLMLNQEVFGALELVSFNDFAQYEIEFVEVLSENIASTISSVKINYKTKKLLEQSKIQSEELQAQEEEMRQNMEELQATQEEVERRNDETEILLKNADKRNIHIETLLDVVRTIQKKDTIEDIFTTVMSKVCDHIKWPISHIYMPSKSDVNVKLEPLKLWVDKSVGIDIDKFKEKTEETYFDPGEGLPGRAYQSADAHWILDVTNDQNFPRKEIAKECGIKSAFCFPIVDEDNVVVAILEFYTQHIHEPDKELLKFMKELGEIVGALIKKTAQLSK